jgi:3-hydroxybutyryl-CoA dehydrogenase
MTEQPVIGVVGLGVMGLGIAHVFAQAGYQVYATDQQQRLRDSAVQRLNESLSSRVSAGKMNGIERMDLLERFRVVPDLNGLKTCGLVIEAIVEDFQAKQNLFVALESTVGSRCVLASNTSSLSIGELARRLEYPHRFLGFHFFNPAPVMKLVELIPHVASDPASLALVRHVAEAAGKTVIACADRPGFIVNRCARPFYGEALALLEEGHSPSDIDAAMLQAGYRIGPLSLIDLVGADINLATTRSLAHAMNNHPRYHVFDALIAQVAEGNLGRKSGKGFLFPERPGIASADAEEIALRIQSALVNEAAFLFGEGAVDEGGIDTAMKLGLNFPRGPFETARAIGFEQVRNVLHALESAAPLYLKGRYLLAPALENLA